MLRRPAAGFSLLEVLVALALLVLAALLGEQLLWIGSQSLGDARQRSLALQLAELELERLRGEYGIAQVPCREAGVAQGSRDERIKNTDYRVGWQVDSRCSPVRFQLTVTVGWQGASARQSLRLFAESGDAGWR
ncbi:prepilin-type N-terminal cleavage/methylation domain-containing protein [Crenobacter caeni]|uniref:Prepilin-type N-terminal cleavage/methylation domain-containing protein n=1 Tax=Crenobacter caeni TaxID=2705474 RepID=A0A6B2KTJ9_9NEIS|nr:prepilin-type N-terminal cleavage/methylation domain-containing protein [Crenobacter caeni]NDV13461.1 prepilin-type N-terminal cleavage/methylation domain-containing protein [Crenobacter caeni]